ncbi:flagellar basal body P-ring protein FlgI [Leptospira sp. GIMC2001]|uniref:flagellar basal body P-ring protein FlgI n=1 Tax=Leptospira sp. GIMC2001 TaxID=1513297 RepID=UPI0004A5C3F4|nr:flagellar basal body P-ring protein FlgI [Leptospira sp. GIMC2001]AID56245.1 flagellar P-ring protein FlgI [Leptospira sp. GIMC2001]WCL48081.1 flagellar basal body P-ring protein FlgI [Leptospira sp. GIMC2001]
MKSILKSNSKNQLLSDLLLKSMNIFSYSALNSAIFVSLFLILHTSSFAVEVRLGDLAKIQGTRENQLTGFGIVVGLAGTGDTRSAFTSEVLHNYLNNLGVDSKLRPKDTRNVASVLVIANIPNWAKSGDRIDVVVSSIGDARSLEGGVLLQSPLKAGNGQTIAVASGVLQFGSGEESGRKSYGKKNQKNNTALVTGGAIVEKDFLVQAKIDPDKINPDARNPDDKGSTDNSSGNNSDIANKKLQETFRVQLIYPSYSTLNSIMEKLAEAYPMDEIQPKVLSKREFEINIPKDKEPIAFLAELEDIKIEPELPARVVIDERMGTVIMGGNLAMEEVAVSKQGLKLKLEAKGKSRYFWTENEDRSESVFYIKKTNNVQGLVEELNKLGATTKDVIAILQGLRKSGILHAEVIIQ